MPQVLLTDSITCELGSQEPWPKDVKLFMSFKVEQILLPENAATLSVQMYLKMCDLPFAIEERNNAEYMSPNGKVPFIKAGIFILTDLDPIIAYVANKGISLTEDLDKMQQADMRAYMSLVNTVLAKAELYITWLHPTVYEEVTKPRYGSTHTWPLNRLLTYQKWQMIVRNLKVLGWKHKTLEEVYGEVDNCCKALSERLDNQPYFFGAKPTELDAFVFGHLYTILTTPLPDTKLATTVRNYDNLIRLCGRIEKDFFTPLEPGPVTPAAATSPQPNNGHSSSNGEEYDKCEDFREH